MYVTEKDIFVGETTMYVRIKPKSERTSITNCWYDKMDNRIFKVYTTNAKYFCLPNDTSKYIRREDVVVIEPIEVVIVRPEGWYSHMKNVKIQVFEYPVSTKHFYYYPDCDQHIRPILKSNVALDPVQDIKDFTIEELKEELVKRTRPVFDDNISFEEIKSLIEDYMDKLIGKHEDQYMSTLESLAYELIATCYGLNVWDKIERANKYGI
jgi:hypothetical protein